MSAHSSGGSGGRRERVRAPDPYSEKLFVARLPRHWQSSDLEERFKQYGKIRDANVVVRSDGSSKCFGFVRFRAVEDALKAFACCKGSETSSGIRVEFAGEKKIEESNARGGTHYNQRGRAPIGPQRFSSSRDARHSSVPSKKGYSDASKHTNDRRLDGRSHGDGGRGNERKIGSEGVSSQREESKRRLMSAMFDYLQSDLGVKPTPTHPTHRGKRRGK